MKTQFNEIRRFVGREVKDEIQAVNRKLTDVSKANEEKLRVGLNEIRKELQNVPELRDLKWQIS